ncbi:MAG: hypothetical protein NC548_37700 [Lachnospiraceae bacterium]|nr:hypothetical protein [Lachnospiraceae bacterium]
MGKATIIRDSAYEIRGVSSQTLQMARQNGVMANVTDIDLSNPESALNRPHVVTDKTFGVPADLSVGVLESFCSGTNKSILVITGLTKSDTTMIWASVASIGAGGNVVNGAWKSLTVQNDAFTGATATAAGLAGLVPAPGVGDEESVLLGNGTWKKPDPPEPVIDKYTVNIATDGGSIVLTYNTGETETLTKLSDTQYTVVEKDADGNTTRTYKTTLDAKNNISVVVS